MRKVLAITMTLMIAATVLIPAMGYTIQSAGNQSYSAISGPKVNYSISSGVPSHNLTLAMVLAKMSVKTPAVQGRIVPYSFKAGGIVPYSMKLIGEKGAPTMGETIGQPAAIEKVGQPAVPENVTLPIVTEKVAQPIVPENVTLPTVTKNVTLPSAPVQVAVNVTNQTNETAPLNKTMPVTAIVTK